MANIGHINPELNRPINNAIVHGDSSPRSVPRTICLRTKPYGISIQEPMRLWRNGARESRVDEPPSAQSFELTPFRVTLTMWFNEIAEPRQLLATELAAIVKDCGGSYRAAAKLIGASESFILQNATAKTYRCNRKVQKGWRTNSGLTNVFSTARERFSRLLTKILQMSQIYDIISR